MTAQSHHTFTQAQGLTELAQRILHFGPATALKCSLSARECREWENSARRYLNALADGLEDEEFAEMVDEFNAEPVGYGLPDEDWLRGETSVWGMLMSDDWQAGDLALCVNDGVYSKAGAIYSVIDFVLGGGVSCHRCGLRNWGTDTLLLVGITPAGTCSGGTASRFRKIHPLTDEERESFLADLREPSQVPA